MELNVNVGYTQVLELVYQLSEKDTRKLMKQIQSKFENTDKGRMPIKELILQAPTWTNEEYDNYLEVRKHINQSRLK